MISLPAGVAGYSRSGVTYPSDGMNPKQATPSFSMLHACNIERSGEGLGTRLPQASVQDNIPVPVTV